MWSAGRRKISDHVERLKTTGGKAFVSNISMMWTNRASSYCIATAFTDFGLRKPVCGRGTIGADPDVVFAPDLMELWATGFTRDNRV